MRSHRLEVADVFHAHQKQFLQPWGPVISRQQHKALRDIGLCRTAALGAHLQQCDTCSYQNVSYLSRRNRHCPKCQSTARLRHGRHWHIPKEVSIDGPLDIGFDKARGNRHKKDAGDAENEHKRALRLGMIHPADPWPAPEKQAPQVPTLREFTKQFLAYVEVQKKAGTKRFYEICSNRVLRFSPLADAALTDVTGELIGNYAQWRRSTSADDSILTVNGELRTLRRMMRLAHEWERSNSPQK